jgi:hypothetical protein
MELNLAWEELQVDGEANIEPLVERAELQLHS